MAKQKKIREKVAWYLRGIDSETCVSDPPHYATADGLLAILHAWGLETCPHDYGDGTRCYRHACGACWAELKEIKCSRNKIREDGTETITAKNTGQLRTEAGRMPEGK